MRRWRLSETTIFGVGLAVRLMLIAAAMPAIHTRWFVPFLSRSLQGGLDPWSAFLAAGGDPASFPYGLPYLILLAPPVLAGMAIAGTAGAHIALGLSMLALELVLLKVLRAVAGRPLAAGVTLTYWLSPLPIYVGYWHGQLDVLPVVLLISGLLALRAARFATSGGLLGAALAAKFSMLLPLPFVALFLAGRPRLRPFAPQVAAAGALAAGLFLLPALLSPGFRQMVLRTPQAAKTFSLALPLGPSLEVYVLPFATLALLYWAWQVRRLDFNLLWAFTGTAFMAVLLLTPASPGWVLWATPFLALHTARAGRLGHVLYWPFAFAFVALHVLTSQGASLPGGLSLDLAGLAETRIPSILLTVALASGAALAFQLARRGILQSSFRLTTRRPIVVGVAGDSSSGKDTLIEAIAAMVGEANVAHVSGDNYHIWDRHMPMWQAMTHLNPKANDLEAFGLHVAQLADGHTVLTRHYDHAVGRMSEPLPLRPQEVVAASGLHALWSPSLRRGYDLRVFMDMDEDLRRFFKIRRDVGRRGHALEQVLASLDRRRADAERFIQPQARNADIVLRLEPRHPSAVEDLGRDVDVTLLRLVMTMAPGRNFGEPARLLTSLCGMQVIERPLADGRNEVVIEGEPSVEDIAAAAARLCPAMTEFLCAAPEWRAGLTGVMQIIILCEFDRSRRQRGRAA